MTTTFFTAYPWDIQDEGVDATLDRLCGDVGVTGLALWATVPPVVELRARELKPRIFRTEGGLCFRPSSRASASGRLLAAAGDALANRSGLESIVESCHKRNIKVRLIVSAGRTGHLAAHNPALCARNVLDDHSQNSICLLNPEVGAFLCETAADLTSMFAPAAISLADLCVGWSEAFAPEPARASIIGFPTEPAMQSLLSLCFCESCRQRATDAGLDISEVQETVAARLREGIGDRSQVARDVAEMAADHASLGAYFCWRNGELSRLLDRVRQDSGIELLIYRELDQWRQGLFEGLDLSAISGVITHLRSPAELATASPSSPRGELLFTQPFINSAPGPLLVSAMSDAAQRGFETVEFENYALCSDEVLTSIRQGIRIARRSTAGAV